MKKRTWQAALAASLLPLAGQAANLLGNGTFDANTAVWQGGNVWDGTRDAGGSSTLGSLRLADRAGGGTRSFQCVPVTAGATYAVQLQMLIPTQSALPGEAFAEIQWNSMPCANVVAQGDLGVAQTPSILSTDPVETWQSYSRYGELAPAGTVSATVMLTAKSNLHSLNTDFIANFDNVELTLKLLTVTTIVAQPGSGSISPSGAVPVAQGTPQVLAMTANPGYHLDSVTGCGGTLAGSTYTTAPVMADCTVTAWFMPNAGSATPVPSLSSWGLGLLGTLLGVMGMVGASRRRHGG